MAKMDWRVWGFLSPETRKRILAEERHDEVRRFEQLQQSREPSIWDDMGTKFEKCLFLDAKSWNAKLLFNTPVMAGLPGAALKNGSASLVRCPGTRWYYANQRIPKTHCIDLMQNTRRGKVYFSDDIVTPILFSEDRGETTTWMSYTPAEVMTQRMGIILARGRVVIGGLGLGWFLNQVCLKKSVTEVVVVDREPSLIKWLKPVLVKAYPALTTKKITWKADDVWKFMEGDAANHASSRYLLDIWPTYPTVSHELNGWRKKLGKKNVWGWGCESW